MNLGKNCIRLLIFAGVLTLFLSCAQLNAPQREEELNNTLTPIPSTDTPAPPTSTTMPTDSYIIMCTPPACAPDEMYYCPGDCPGGCGTMCATATPGTSSGTGFVWGKICFPEETLPEMTIHFQNTVTQELLEFPIAENQDSYEFEIPAGVYVAFARLFNSDIGGGYTQFVICNQNLSCIDHSLVPFLVRDGHVTLAVDICDWDTGQIVFPTLP